MSYPTTLEEDEMLLKSSDVKPYGNRYNSILMVRGEKMIYRHYIQLYNFVRSLDGIKTSCQDVKNEIY